MDRIKFKLNGLVPQMQHSNKMADPLNIYKKAVAQYTSKRKKTDADELMIARIEWEAGIYFDADGWLCWPGENIERMLLDAAKKNRNGVKIKEGIRVEENFARLDVGVPFRLQKFPTSADEIPSASLDKLYPKFFDRRVAKIQKASVIRTRPRFDKWAIEFTVLYNEDIINEATIIETMTIAGNQIGLSDYRPRYGLFEFKVVK